MWNKLALILRYRITRLCKVVPNHAICVKVLWKVYENSFKHILSTDEPKCSSISNMPNICENKPTCFKRNLCLEWYFRHFWRNKFSMLVKLSVILIINFNYFNYCYVHLIQCNIIITNNTNYFKLKVHYVCLYNMILLTYEFKYILFILSNY